MFQIALDKGPVPKLNFFQEVKKAVRFYSLLVSCLTKSLGNDGYF